MGVASDGVIGPKTKNFASDQIMIPASFVLFYLSNADGSVTAFEPHLKIFATSACKAEALAQWLCLARAAHPQLSERLAGAAADQARASSAKVWLAESGDDASATVYVFESNCDDEVVLFAPAQRQIATSTDQLWREELSGMLFDERIDTLCF